MIVPSVQPAASLHNAQNLVGSSSPEHYHNHSPSSIYQTPPHYPNSPSHCYTVHDQNNTGIEGINYREWENRGYPVNGVSPSSQSSPQENLTAAQQEYYAAQRKIQDVYSGYPLDMSTYSSNTNNYPDYQPSQYTSNSYYPQTENSDIYYNEQLAAQQYYQQQAAAAEAELYYAASRSELDGDYSNGVYLNEADGYFTQSPGGRIHRGYDRGTLTTNSPDCHKFGTLYMQTGALLHRQDNSTLLCAVCGDNAACQHYGVRTCEGCKGFFKRTVQKKAKYVCLAEKKCPVDKRRRNRCQFCRFQKCLSVGMVKEVVRSDSLKGRRGRLPSKPKSANEKPASPPLPLVTTLVRAHVDNSADSTSLDLTSEVLEEKDVLKSLIETLVKTLPIIKSFFVRGSGAFNEITNEDRERITQLRAFHFFFLRFAQRLKVGVDMVTLPNNKSYHRSQVHGAAADLFASLADFNVNLTRSEVDIQSFSCMLILSVLRERSGLKTPIKVESAHSKVMDSLRDHCTYNPEAQNHPHLNSRVLHLMSDLEPLCRALLSRLQKAIKENDIDVPKELNLLFH